MGDSIEIWGRGSESHHLAVANIPKIIDTNYTLSAHYNSENPLFGKFGEHLLQPFNQVNSIFNGTAEELLQKLNSHQIISFIGTRKVNSREMGAVSHSIKTMANAGILDDQMTATGLALGIDVAAARSSLDQNITTIGILPTGLDFMTPKQNLIVALEAVKHGGILLSPYSQGQINGSDLASSYPYWRRNQLLAALSDVVVVGAADSKSGTFTTIQWAAFYGKPIIFIVGENTPGQERYSDGAMKRFYKEYILRRKPNNTNEPQHLQIPMNQIIGNNTNDPITPLGVKAAIVNSTQNLGHIVPQILQP